MKDIRTSLAAIVTILISIGVVMIYSSSGVYALYNYGDSTYFLSRHLIFLLLGTIAMFSMMAFDYRKLRNYAKPLMLITIILLVLVLIPHIGKASYGARRWFKVGPINFQPAELAKISIMIYTADFLARKKAEVESFWQTFVPLVTVLGVTCLLVVKQPDLGSTVLLASVVLTMMFVAGSQPRHIGVLILCALPVLYYMIAKVPYRLKRIIAFIDPWQDSQGIGFQLSQSQIALGSGGLFGVGLGHSVQKLFYLPAAHTDFILSIIGEEFGLAGTLMIVILFGAFIWQGARLVKRVMDPFGYYLSVGIIMMFGLQAVVNIGVSIGAFPTKGLPLPFISYGGSALIFDMVAIGLLLNISRTQDR